MDDLRNKPAGETAELIACGARAARHLNRRCGNLSVSFDDEAARESKTREPLPSDSFANT